MADADAQLLERAWQGDRVAFGRIMERHQRMVFAYAVSLVRDRDGAEDVMQEVFLRAWRSVREITDAGALLSWFFSTTRNVTKEYFRDKAKFRKGDARKRPDSGVFRLDDRQAKLMEILADLPDEMRVVISLKYMESMTCAEIAKELGQPIGTVTSQLARAYEEIRRRMKKK